MDKKGKGKRNSLLLKAYYVLGSVPGTPSFPPGASQIYDGHRCSGKEEKGQRMSLPREVVATLSLPLPSLSQWRREARSQACSLLGTRVTSSLWTQAYTPFHLAPVPL